MFGRVAGLLFGVDDSGAIAFGIVHVICMVALLAGLFLIARGATKSGALAVFVLVTGWLTVNGEHSVAGSYIWSCYLQPSLIGSAGWMIALGMYVQRRPLATGIALAIGGIFHANFLILGIGMFALAELVTEREQRVRRLALLLAPQLVALAVLAPEILAHSSGSDPDRALWILVQFHAPFHYKPSWILRTLPSLVRWVALAIVVAPVAVEFGHGVAVRRLVWWAAIAAALCTVGTAVMLIPAFLPLTRLYVWRLAPFAIMGAQVVIVIAAAATIADFGAWRRQRLWRALVAVALVGWIFVTTPFMTAAAAEWSVWLLLGAIVIARLLPPRWRTFVLPVVAVATLAAPLWYRRDSIANPQFVIASDGADADAVYAWARTTSSVDAVFVTPPDQFGFRLFARRAAYADFKSPPLTSDGLVEWHERLCRMTGAGPNEKIPAHRKRWVESTGDELLARSKELGADYLMLDRSPTHDRISAQPIFSNAAFAVFALR